MRGKPPKRTLERISQEASPKREASSTSMEAGRWKYHDNSAKISAFHPNHSDQWRAKWSPSSATKKEQSRYWRRTQSYARAARKTRKWASSSAETAKRSRKSPRGSPRRVSCSTRIEPDLEWMKNIIVMKISSSLRIRRPPIRRCPPCSEIFLCNACPIGCGLVGSPSVSSCVAFISSTRRIGSPGRWYTTGCWFCWESWKFQWGLAWRQKRQICGLWNTDQIA